MKWLTQNGIPVEKVIQSHAHFTNTQIKNAVGYLEVLVGGVSLQYQIARRINSDVACNIELSYL